MAQTIYYMTPRYWFVMNSSKTEEEFLIFWFCLKVLFEEAFSLRYQCVHYHTSLGKATFTPSCQILNPHSTYVLTK